MNPAMIVPCKSEAHSSTPILQGRGPFQHPSLESIVQKYIGVNINKPTIPFWHYFFSINIMEAWKLCSIYLCSKNMPRCTFFR